MTDMAVFGVSAQVNALQEAIHEGNPAKITVKTVELICMIFGLTRQCFTGDTLVSTEDGLRPIAEIAVGDYVWSENTEAGEKELKKVLGVSVTESKALVHVTLSDGTKIDTTENHPFFTEGKGWCAAGELETRDVLRSEDGKKVSVETVTVEQLATPVKVYNLEIEDNHTYYVSSAEVLVHNGCGDGSSEGGKTSDIPNASKRQTPDQSALHKLAKEAEKNAKNGNPISYDEAKILDEWAKEYNVPQHHPAEVGSGQHFPGGNYMDHTHIYNIHVPYKY